MLAVRRNAWTRHHARAPIEWETIPISVCCEMFFNFTFDYSPLATITFGQLFCITPRAAWVQLALLGYWLGSGWVLVRHWLGAVRACYLGTAS
eukprot:693058-Lingulodinium_polyedra.AAC.1